MTLGILILGLLGLSHWRKRLSLALALGSFALLGAAPDAADAFECAASPAVAYHGDGSPAPASNRHSRVGSTRALDLRRPTSGCLRTATWWSSPRWCQ